MDAFHYANMHTSHILFEQLQTNCHKISHQYERRRDPGGRANRLALLAERRAGPDWALLLPDSSPPTPEDDPSFTSSPSPNHSVQVQRPCVDVTKGNDSPSSQQTERVEGETPALVEGGCKHRAEWARRLSRKEAELE